MGEFKNCDIDRLLAYADGAAEYWSWAIDVLVADPEEACPREEGGIGTPRQPTWVCKEDAWHMGRGGFEPNQATASSYTQLISMYPRVGMFNEGDDILMCQAIGARLWHMSNLAGLGCGYRLPGTSASASTAAGRRGIFAGPAGGRFVNETASSCRGRIGFGGGWSIPPTPMPAFAPSLRRLPLPLTITLAGMSTCR